MSSTPTTQRTPSPLPRTKDPPKPPQFQKRSDRTKPTTWKTYAAAAATQLISPEKLINDRSVRESSTDSSESVWTPQASHYRPLKRGIEPHTVLYDVTELGNCPDEFYSQINSIITSDQHLGAKYHKENKRTLIEIICDSDTTCQTLIDKGVEVKGSTLYPVKSLDQEAEVVTIMLSNLPFINKLDLQKGLVSVLSDYGQVLDALLFTDPKSGFFFGKGMAVLNTTPPAEVLKRPDYDPAKPFYKALTHNMDFMGERRFYVSWRIMPSHCLYCHDPEHLIDKCPVRPVLKCWKCDGVGHYKSQCTAQKTNNGRKKPKTYHHRATEDEFSEDEDFEQNAANLAAEAEKNYKVNANKPVTPEGSNKGNPEQGEPEPRRNSVTSVDSSVIEEEQRDNEQDKESDDMDVDESDNPVVTTDSSQQLQIQRQKTDTIPTNTRKTKLPLPKALQKQPLSPLRRVTRSKTLEARQAAKQAALEENQRQEQAIREEHQRLTQAVRKDQSLENMDFTPATNTLPQGNQQYNHQH